MHSAPLSLLRSLTLGVLLLGAAACTDRPVATAPSDPGRASALETPYPCDFEADPDCDGSVGGGDGNVDPCPDCNGLFIVGWTWRSCVVAAGWDNDYDGVDDACEGALAQVFAPGLQMAPDCVFDDNARFGARVGGDYGFAVQREPGFDPNRLPRIRIAYLPAYYADCGAYKGIEEIAAVAGAPTTPHRGDSELILIDVHFNEWSQHWVTQRVFLSAHCPKEHCRWYDDLSVFQWVGGKLAGAPIVWVSERKHANYPSQSDCFIPYVDTCETSHYFLRFPAAYAQQNIGSRAHPLRFRTAVGPAPDCVGPFWPSDVLKRLNPSAYTAPAVECWWSEYVGSQQVRFNGWLGPGPFGYTQSASYGQHLRTYAGF